NPAVRLNAAQLAVLRTYIGLASPALADANRIADLPQGRYADRKVAFLSSWGSLPHSQEAREVANLLLYDAILRAHDGDARGALTANRAVVNVGRSIGDDPD